MFPPRPKHRIRPADLPKYEKQGIWVAQLKFNGTRSPINIKPTGEVVAWTRHGTPHKQWELSSDVADQLRSLGIQDGLEYWLDAELLNNKTTDPHYKNRLVLFDVLQAGHYLFGDPDLMGRHELLFNLCGRPTELEPKNGVALKVTENVWLAETFASNFTDHWESRIELDEIEGLVLKKKRSVLDDFGAKEYEVSWQLRCRKEHKSYSF